MTWKFFARHYQTGQYGIIDVADFYLPDEPRIRQWQINVEGQEKPEIPRGKISEADLTRWKAEQLEKGSKILEAKW